MIEAGDKVRCIDNNSSLYGEEFTVSSATSDRHGRCLRLVGKDWWWSAHRFKKVEEKPVSDTLIPGRKYKQGHWRDSDALFFVGIASNGRGVFESTSGFIHYGLNQTWVEIKEPQKGVGYVNVYRDGQGNAYFGDAVHPTAAEADRVSRGGKIARAKVEWVEGRFDE